MTPKACPASVLSGAFWPWPLGGSVLHRVYKHSKATPQCIQGLNPHFFLWVYGLWAEFMQSVEPALLPVHQQGGRSLVQVPVFRMPRIGGGQPRQGA